MRVVSAYPPNFPELRRAFPWMAGRAMFFAWGSILYNPRKAMIGKALMAHEQVHGERQGSDPEGWWRRYIDDPQFRLDEEVAAHRAEWRVLRQMPQRDSVRAQLLHSMCERLASPLYRLGIDFAEAERLITTEPPRAPPAKPPTPLQPYKIVRHHTEEPITVGDDPLLNLLRRIHG